MDFPLSMALATSQYFDRIYIYTYIYICTYIFSFLAAPMVGGNSQARAQTCVTVVTRATGVTMLDP